MSEWVQSAPAAQRESDTTFTVAGDQTETYTLCRRVEAFQGGSSSFFTITSSSFSAGNNETTVTVDGTLPDPLGRLSYALISSDADTTSFNAKSLSFSSVDFTQDNVREALEFLNDQLQGGGGASNSLINGGFRVAQRGTTFTANNDDTYLLDRWILLSDGNGEVDIDQETSTVPTGAYAALKATVPAAKGNKKFGFVQILEARDSAALIDGTASLSFKARVNASSAIGNIRAAVMAWSGGTADSVTSDVVSAWNAAGTDPTLATNWTYENTPSNLSVTENYATFKIEGVSIDTSGAKNVAVFIWVDDTDADVADLLYLADVQLKFGGAATDFERRHFEQELALCQRYYWRESALSGNHQFGFGMVVTSTPNPRARITGHYPVSMREIPTFGKGTALSDFQLFDADDQGAPTDMFLHDTAGASIYVLDVDGSGLTLNRPMRLLAANTNAYVEFDSEL